MAINCGHEIQVNDDPGGGEPQKTGSIYNFRPNNITQAQPGPRGDWTNYEVRVEGQQYTILREGEIINQFNNAIPRNSSRGGDAPTQARQFASGYIGLQNHGASDRVRYRNVRVTDLSPGARAGNQPFTVSGLGNHTVEFRSIDWAGNVEEKQATTFRIGQLPLPSAPPVEIVAPTFQLESIATPKLGSVARRGLKVSVECTGPMQGSAALKVTRSVKRRLGLRSDDARAQVGPMHDGGDEERDAQAFAQGGQGAAEVQARGDGHSRDPARRSEPGRPEDHAPGDSPPLRLFEGRSARQATGVTGPQPSRSCRSSCARSVDQRPLATRCSVRASTSSRAPRASSTSAAKMSVSAASRMRSCSAGWSFAGPRSSRVFTTRP